MPLKRKSKAEINDVAVNVTNPRTGEVVKSSGAPLEPHTKYNCPKGSVGMSIGVTKNMGDYESLRIDVWCTDKVAENETKGEAFARLTEILSQALSDTADEIVGVDED